MTCRIEGCTKPRGGTSSMCNGHRHAKARYGDPLYPVAIRGNDEARFWSKVDRRADDECWPWTGTVLSDGYGQFFVDGDKVRAHRYAYELLVGPIPEGLHIDHVWDLGCTRRDCVNPAHMEPVTLLENTSRGNCYSAANRRKETCPNGHAYDAKWRTSTGGWRRVCKTCHNEQQRERRRAKRQRLAG